MGTRRFGLRARISILPAVYAALVEGLSLCVKRSRPRFGCAFRRHDFKAAEADFLRATREAPQLARAWKFLGMTYIEEEKFRKPPLDSCQRACDLNPREENACYYLGHVVRTRFRTVLISLEAYRKAHVNGADPGYGYIAGSGANLGSHVESKLKRSDTTKPQSTAGRRAQRNRVMAFSTLQAGPRIREHCSSSRGGRANTEADRFEAELKQARLSPARPEGCGRVVHSKCRCSTWW